ncbi:MAG TPA: glycosyltransferase family 2 protein [Gammaproteobacteria bacterium]|nr:glycosyltransferase family 2 protein [Gammaproteobacteria bacterium]
MTTPEKTISFIIPHKGRIDMLRDTLASIAGQDYPPAAIEVFVVTQTAGIRADELLPAGGPRLQVVEQPETETISALRNHGASLAGGDFLAFLDADIALSANWITTMIELLEASPRRVLVSAMQTCPDDAPFLERLRTRLSNAVVDRPVAFLPGRNLFLTPDTFRRIGGFPKHLETCEDYYFTDRANGLGELFYTSAASYRHLGEDRALGELFRKEIWRGQSNLRAMRGRRIPLREIPSLFLPGAILLLLLLALGSLLAGRGGLALIFLGLGLLPVLAYSLRLHRLGGGRLGLPGIVVFYLVYFLARAIGTLKGLPAALRPGNPSGAAP